MKKAQSGKVKGWKVRRWDGERLGSV